MYPPSVTPTSFGIRPGTVDFLPVWGMFTVGSLLGYYAAVSRGGDTGRLRANVMHGINRREGQAFASLVFRRLSWK